MTIDLAQGEKIDEFRTKVRSQVNPRYFVIFDESDPSEVRVWRYREEWNHRFTGYGIYFRPTMRAAKIMAGKWLRSRPAPKSAP